MEATKYAVEHPEYKRLVHEDSRNEFENLPGDEFEYDYDENIPNEQDDTLEEELSDDDLDPEILNNQDNNDAETLDVHSTVHIYVGSTGKIAVPQHIHYAHRGEAFKYYSLYEFASIVDVVAKKEKNDDKVGITNIYTFHSISYSLF